MVCLCVIVRIRDKIIVHIVCFLYICYQFEIFGTYIAIFYINDPDREGFSCGSSSTTEFHMVTACLSANSDPYLQCEWIVNMRDKTQPIATYAQ